MGIDFNHDTGEGAYSRCCPHWSYSGFNRFRKRLAEAEGFELEAMDGFTDNGRSWDDVTTDLKPLLNYSDCDGELTAEECKQVYPRLREICEAMDDEYDRQAGLTLAECMLACAAANKTLEFC